MSDIVYKNFAFSTTFLHGYRELRIPIVDANGVPAWPDVYPISRIEMLRETVGPRHFSSQMMLEFVSMDRARLDPDALHMYNADFDARTAKIGDNQITSVVVYWDPSTGRAGRDGSVCVLLYRDDHARRAFIHDVVYLTVSDGELHPLARQCEMILDFMRRHGVGRIIIETNGIGNALPEIMRDVATRRGAGINVQKITNNKNKQTRILDAIEPVLTTGRLYAHARVQHTPLLAEMLGWCPIGTTGHDDGLDALAGAITAVPTPVRPLGGRVRPIMANTNFTI